MNAPKIAVVIPCRNEAATIGLLIECVHRQAEAIQVIVVDDGSTDETALMATAAGATVISSDPARRGLSDVYRKGILHAFQHTAAEWIFEMDAGGGHDPAELRRFFRRLDYGFDIVFGQRFSGRAVYDGPWTRRLLSWLGTWVTNRVEGTDFLDATSGYIGYTRLAVMRTQLTPFQAAGHYYQTEVRRRAVHERLSWCEVPITFRTSKSSLRWRAVWEAIKLACG